MPRLEMPDLSYEWTRLSSLAATDSCVYTRHLFLSRLTYIPYMPVELTKLDPKNLAQSKLPLADDPQFGGHQRRQ
jgi:hypothetical protein